MTENTDNNLHQPHDKIFKQVFSEPEETASMLVHYLPEELAQKIDWTSLKRIDKEFVDEHFRSSEADLLFQAGLSDQDEEVYVYILFEHQSTPSFWLRFRLLKYMCRIWDETFKENPNQTWLKPIIPVVFYQGKGEWKYSTQFRDLVADIGKNDRYIPSFEHFLVDQSQYDLDEFKGKPNARIAQLLLRAAFYEKIREVIRLFARMLDEYYPTPGIDHLQMFIRYLEEISNEIDYAEIHDIILGETQSSTIEGEVMTAAEQLRQEGIEKGIIIGKIIEAQTNSGQHHFDTAILKNKTEQELTLILNQVKQA